MTDPDAGRSRRGECPLTGAVDVMGAGKAEIHESFNLLFIEKKYPNIF